MSFEEKSDVKGMRYDAKFDAHPMFGDKTASKSFSKHGSNQHVNATDMVADRILTGSTGIIPINHEVWGRNKQMRKLD